MLRSAFRALVSTMLVTAGLLSLLPAFPLTSRAAEEEMVSAKIGGMEAAVPALKIPPNARFERDWMEEHRKWLDRVMVVPFAEQVKGKPWADAAVAFLQKSNAAWRPNDLTDLHPELAQLAEALLASGCQEPLVHFFAGYWRYRNSRQYRELLLGINPLTYYNTKDGEKQIGVMQDAANALDQAGYPRAPLRLFASEIARAWARGYYADRSAPWRAKISHWAAKALSEGSFRPEEAGIFVGQTMRWAMYSRPELAELATAVEKSSLPDWARDAILGALAVEGAWKDRGGGWASSVTEQGWRGFSENLSRASAYFEKSWKEDPNHPEVCASYLSALLTGEAQPGVDPYEWFSRAVALEADHPPAYSKWLWYHRPRWGGSMAEMLAMGRACLEAKRYDTNLPELFIKAVIDTASESGNWRDVAHIPWVGEGMVEVTRGQLAEPSRAPEREKLQSLLATRAWMAGKYELAQQTLKEIPNGELHLAALDELQNFKTYPDLMLQELAIFGTPAWPEYEKGAADSMSYLAYDAPAALRHFQAALAAAPKDSTAEKLLRTQVALSEFDMSLASGEWTRVPLNLDAWRVRAGQFSNDADGALVMHTDKDRRGFAWFRNHVGQSYELRGHFSAEPGAKAPPTFGIGLRAHRSIAYEFLHFSCFPTDGGKLLESKLRDHFQDLDENGRRPKSGKVPLREDNEFLVRVTPERVSFQLNGEVVIPDFETKRYVRREFDGRLGLVASHYSAATATRVTSLEIRKTKGDE